jgi:hypothetical protein
LKETHIINIHIGLIKLTQVAEANKLGPQIHYGVSYIYMNKLNYATTPIFVPDMAQWPEKKV